MKKKYITPVTNCLKIDNEMLLADSVGVDQNTPATEWGSAKEKQNFTVWDWEADDFEEEN